jgi:hypothetical protein
MPAFKCSRVIGTGNAEQDDQRFAYDNLRIYPLDACTGRGMTRTLSAVSLEQPPHCPEQSREQQY